MEDKKRIYKNLKREIKWLGIIDYKTLTFIIIYCLVIFVILKKLQFNFTISIYLFIILTGPLIVINFVNAKNNSAIDVIVIIIKYLLKQKKYVNLKYFCNDKMYVYKNNIK